jgi:glucose/arabinose dehydrogenase
VVGEEYLERRAELSMDMSRVLRVVLLGAAASLGLAAQAGVAPVAPVPNAPEQALHLPSGFEISVFAKLPPAGEQYFRGPRFMAFGPDGHLYVSLGLDNRVVMLADRNHVGHADEVVTVSDALDGPQGLAFVADKLLVANQNGVVRLEPVDGHWPAKVTPFISNLPAGGHTLKNLKQGPDGFLYLNVGSSCNVCVEEDPMRAAMLRYTAEGQPAGALVTVGRHATSPIWATGLRNSQGFAWQPQSGGLFATNDGADMRSESKGTGVNDDLPPEHLNRIQPGQFYGWPYCWGNRFTDPNFSGPPGKCAEMTPPEITFPAHSTPIGITFLNASKFPAEYREDALVALHGSWNRENPSGYKLVHVHFEHGKPVAVSDFMTGWLQSGKAWGRPVDVVVGPDGAVYVSDDRAGLIYRIEWDAKHFGKH